MSEQKQPLCCDCKFMRRDFPFFWTMTFARCAAPQDRDPVDGAARHYCSTQRLFEIDSCGKSGKWFVAKAEGR